MRIQPDHDTLPALRPTAGSASSDEGFANALTSARNSADPDLPAATDKSNVGKVPLAQRWGEYGKGATAEGYGPPPNAADYSDVPIGPDQPLSPLNPSGITTTPAFVIPGYTARGTPVPPGFYNIAYYNWYLREGGTPLKGFPALQPGATLTETYGKFGDGVERATSFVSGTQPAVDARSVSAAATAAASAADTSGSAASAGGGATSAVQASASVLAAAPRPNVAASAAGTVSHAATASTVGAGAERSISSRDRADASATTNATANAAIRDAAAGAAPNRDLDAIVRAELEALLRDVLRVS